MGQVMKSIGEPMATEVSELYAPRPETADFRTLLKGYLLDPVLPLVTLVVMGALTIAMLVLVVTAVADMEQVLHGGSVSNDPWSGPVASPDPQAGATVGATEPYDSWPSSPADNSSDARLARTLPER